MCIIEAHPLSSLSQLDWACAHIIEESLCHFIGMILVGIIECGRMAKLFNEMHLGRMKDCWYREISRTLFWYNQMQEVLEE